MHVGRLNSNAIWIFQMAFCLTLLADGNQTQKPWDPLTEWGNDRRLNVTSAWPSACVGNVHREDNKTTIPVENAASAVGVQAAERRWCKSSPVAHTSVTHA